MILGTIRRILKEDLARSGEVPGWADSLLSPLNQFIDTVTLSLRNNLTFRDNFACRIITNKFQHGVEREINPQTRSKIIGMIPLSSGNEVLDGYRFRVKDNGNIGITLRFVATGADAECTVVFLFG